MSDVLLSPAHCQRSHVFLHSSFLSKNLLGHYMCWTSNQHGPKQHKKRNSGSFQEPKNSPKEEKFSSRISRGCPWVFRADVPGQKLRAGHRNLEKNKRLGADIHDPNAQTSMTPGGAEKLLAEKLSGWFIVPIAEINSSQNLLCPSQSRNSYLVSFVGPAPQII